MTLEALAAGGVKVNATRLNFSLKGGGFRNNFLTHFARDIFLQPRSPVYKNFKRQSPENKMHLKSKTKKCTKKSHV